MLYSSGLGLRLLFIGINNYVNLDERMMANIATTADSRLAMHAP